MKDDLRIYIDEVKTGKRCCFCGELIEGYGNNPAPACNIDGAECCDYCNDTIVLPARFDQLYGGVK